MKQSVRKWAEAPYMQSILNERHLRWLGHVHHIEIHRRASKPFTGCRNIEGGEKVSTVPVYGKSVFSDGN